MTTDALFGYWVIAAVVLLFLLIFGGTWYRIRTNRPQELYRRYDRLSLIDRQLRWGRLLVISLGLVVGLWATNSTATNHYQAILVAPSLWAAICLIGFTGLDWLVLGLNPAGDPLPPPRVRTCLPWKLLGVLFLVSGLLVASIHWAGRVSASDGRSHFSSWVLDGVFNWGRRQPFPGAFYTSLLTYCYPVVLLLGVAGAVAVWKRRAYIPSADYAVLDRGFRRRTIRDLVLACLGAASSTLAMMGLNIAWAYASLGPGSPERTVVVATSGVVGGIAMGLSFWVIANLVFLPSVNEQLELPAVSPVVAVTTEAEVIRVVEVEVLDAEPAAITAEPVGVDQALDDKVGQTAEGTMPMTAVAEELAHEDAVAAELGVTDEPAAHPIDEAPTELNETTTVEQPDQAVAESDTQTAAVSGQVLRLWSRIRQVFRPRPATDSTDQATELAETVEPAPASTSTEPTALSLMKVQIINWIRRITTPRTPTVPSEHSEPTPVEPSEPTPSDPTEPAPSEPTEPAPTEPTEPAPSEPTEPAPSEPSQSVPTEPIAQEPPPQASTPPPTVDPEPHQGAEATEPAVPTDDPDASPEPTSDEPTSTKPAKDGKSGSFNRKRGSKKSKGSR